MTQTQTNPALAKAEALDSEGKHDDAINTLALATQAGDLAAKTILGKRMLVGDRSPYLPTDGARFILEAAQAGNPEAACMVAVFQTIGLFQPKNLQSAIQTLGFAAAQGSRIAREQLILLAGTGEPAMDPTLLENNDPAHWMHLHVQIDLDQWLHIDTEQPVNNDPLLKSFPGLIPLPVCRWLIRLSNERLHPAMVYDANNRRNYRSQTRTNSIAEFNLVENEMLHFLLQEKMSAACGIPMNQFEGTAILNYQPGEQISNHYDFVSPDLPNYEQEIRDNGQRVLTFLIYLNDDYEGGETVFPELDIAHKGMAGEGFFFSNALPDGSSDLRTLHAGAPTRTGQKWIVSQFIRNREVKYIL